MCESVSVQPCVFKADIGFLPGIEAGGCNHRFYAYLSGSNSIRFAALATTWMRCAHGADIEAKFLDALAKTNAYQLKGATWGCWQVAGN